MEFDAINSTHPFELFFVVESVRPFVEEKFGVEITIQIPFCIDRLILIEKDDGYFRSYHSEIWRYS